MFLLEISKSYDKENKCLLGEHKWSQFLKDPTEEEKSSKTCVFYSIYPTCREAGKDGKCSRSPFVRLEMITLSFFFWKRVENR